MMPEKSYTCGETINIEESRTVEFKEVKGRDPIGAIKNAADNYAVGFLNSEGGTIYWGIRDDQSVVGVPLTSKQRDEIRRVVAGKLNEIQPHLDPSQFKTEFFPVLDQVEGNNQRFIVTLTVLKGNPNDLYFTGGGHVYVRTDAVNQKLNGSQINERLKENNTTNPNSLLTADIKRHIQRVRKVFSAHGVLDTQWARFLELRDAPFSVSLKDLSSDEALLEWLDKAKLTWISETFLIRREWLDGEDDCPHVRFHFDKDPAEFFNTISQQTDGLIWEDLPLSPEAYFIRWGTGKDWETKGQSRIFVIVRVPLARLSDESFVYRYITDFEPYSSDYGRTSIQLRAWARLLYVNKGIHCFGCEIEYKDGSELIWEGTHFLEEATNKSYKSLWHPEDNALYPRESLCATETDTFPEVINFLKAYGLPHEETQL